MTDHKWLSAEINCTDISLCDFATAEDTLSSCSLLKDLVPDAPLAIHSIALDVGIGTMLKQEVACQWGLLGFFSRSLAAAEHQYSMFDWKLLAAYSVTRHFWLSIESRLCMLLTDHCPLAQAVQCFSDFWTPWQH